MTRPEGVSAFAAAESAKRARKSRLHEEEEEEEEPPILNEAIFLGWMWICEGLSFGSDGLNKEEEGGGEK